jgi:hypothetical protein
VTECDCNDATAAVLGPARGTRARQPAPFLADAVDEDVPATTGDKRGQNGLEPWFSLWPAEPSRRNPLRTMGDYAAALRSGILSRAEPGGNGPLSMAVNWLPGLADSPVAVGLRPPAGLSSTIVPT